MTDGSQCLMPSWMMATATSCQSRPCLLPSRPYWRYSTSRFCGGGGQDGKGVREAQTLRRSGSSKQLPASLPARRPIHGNAHAYLADAQQRLAQRLLVLVVQRHADEQLDVAAELVLHAQAVAVAAKVARVLCGGGAEAMGGMTRGRGRRTGRVGRWGWRGWPGRTAALHGTCTTRRHRLRAHLGCDGRVAAEGVLHGVGHIHVLPQQVAVHLGRHWVVHLRAGKGWW